MARTGRPETPIRYRLLARIDFDATPGCWEWSGAKVPQGYGVIKRKDGPNSVHTAWHTNWLTEKFLPACLYAIDAITRAAFGPAIYFSAIMMKTWPTWSSKIGPRECVEKSMAAPNWDRMKWFPLDPSSTATLASHNDLAFRLRP